MIRAARTTSLRRGISSRSVSDGPGVTRPPADAAGDQRAGLVPRACRPRRPANGFTLLEVIVAVGLMSLLMLAVYSAMDFYWMYTTSGRDEMERSQLARAILQKIAVDLRSVVFAPEEEETEKEDSDESSGDENAIIMVDPDAFYSSASGGLAGTLDELVIHISRPPRQFDYDAGTDAAASSLSDLRTIRYLLAEDGGDGLAGAVADANDADSDVKGLARLEGDTLTMSLATEESDVATLADNTQLLAPEVLELQFAYLDGGEIYEEWDSSVSNRLPQAVEIIIGFRDPDPPEGRMSSLRTEYPIRRYRLVVAMPLSEPVVEEF